MCICSLRLTAVEGGGNRQIYETLYYAAQVAREILTQQSPRSAGDKN